MRDTLADIQRKLREHAYRNEDCVELNPESPGDLRRTLVIEGRIGSQTAGNWNEVGRPAIRIACQKGYGVAELSSWLRGGVKQGCVTKAGYGPVPDTAISCQNTDANGL